MMVEELKNIVESIDLNLEEAYDQLFNVFTTYCVIPTLTVPLKTKSFVFRSRPNENNIDFAHYSQISYPDSSIVIDYSRANRPHQSMFYASDYFPTTLLELLPRFEDYSIEDRFVMTTGKWVVQSDLHVILIPNPLNERMNNIFKKIDKLIKSRYELDYWSYINTFFCARVSNNKNIYKISSAYCNALLKLSENNGHNIDGILYTSVQDGSGYNITLFPNVVNEKLFLQDVVKNFIRRNKTPTGKYEFNNYETPIRALLENETQTIKW